MIKKVKYSGHVLVRRSLPAQASLCEALALSARASLRHSPTAPIYVSISVLPQPYISTCVISQCYDPVWCNIVFANLEGRVL